MSRKDSVGEIIKTCVTVGTLITLTCGLRIIKAALNDLI